MIDETNPPTYWQLVFMQSRVNGGFYPGDLFPPQSFDWPKETYLQRRLRELRAQDKTESERE